jgi:hypothetical protein
VKGAWIAAPGALPLAPGRPVMAGSRVESKEAGAVITVAFLDGSAQTFAAAFTVDSLHAVEKSGAGRMLAAVAKSIGREKRATVFGISRGSLGVTPAVLKQSGKRIDLAPAIGGLSAGEYRLELTPFEGGAAAEATCSFDPPAGTSATLAVAPGVYTLRVASASGTPVGSATVRVVASAEFAAMAGAFGEGVAMTAAWPAGTDPAAVNHFLTALLIDLAP